MKPSHKLGLLFLGTALLAAAAPLEMQLKERDQESLGKDIRAYYEAVAESEGIAKAKSDLGEEIQKHNEKLSKKAKKEIDLLASTEDLAAIFSFSREYPKRSPVGKVTEFSAETFLGIPVEYSLLAPKGYKAGKGSVPLILIIPDEGKDRADSAREQLDIDWMLGELRDEAVLASLVMPDDVSLWAKRGGDTMGGLETIMFALRQIRADYDIDSNRIFLAGHGAGVAAAVDIGNIFPYVFAGVIGRSGDVGATSPTNFRNLPTYFAGGGSGVTSFEAAAGKLEYKNVTVKPDARLEDVWKWAKSTIRNANPSAITFAPTTPVGGCYWLNIEGFDSESDDKPEITAEIDREKNVIAITSKGIRTVTLMFNDALVDLDREVQVICNGVDHKDKFKRNLSTALDQYFRSNDAGRIYTNFQLYDLPEDEGN